jgi:hypothetical protein
MRVADTGADGTDTIELPDCDGVTVQAGRIASEATVVTVSGVEAYPCGFGKVTRVRSRVKRGVVLRQSPVAGTRRARGAKVALRVSRGP